MKYFAVSSALILCISVPVIAATKPGDVSAPVQLANPLPVTDPAQVVERARQVSGGITANDYPVTAIMTRVSGTSVARIVINEVGRVSGCQAAGSGSDILDETACKLIVERFRFLPARDEKGLAVAETRTQRVSWKIPEGIRLDQSPQPRRMTISFIVGTDGSVSDCKTVDSIPAAGPQIPCPTYVPPYSDAKGNPVKKRVELVTEVNITDSAP